jgi:hypothetical protein
MTLEIKIKDQPREKIRPLYNILYRSNYSVHYKIERQIYNAITKGLEGVILSTAAISRNLENKLKDA